MLPGIALRTEVAECKGGERRMVVAFFVCLFNFVLLMEACERHCKNFFFLPKIQ